MTGRHSIRGTRPRVPVLHVPHRKGAQPFLFLQLDPRSHPDTYAGEISVRRNDEAATMPVSDPPGQFVCTMGTRTGSHGSVVPTVRFVTAAWCGAGCLGWQGWRSWVDFRSGGCLYDRRREQALAVVLGGTRGGCDSISSDDVNGRDRPYPDPVAV